MYIGLTIVVVVALLILLARYAGHRAMRRRIQGRTLDDYARRHPEAVEMGKVYCFACGSSETMAQGVVSNAAGSLETHYCAQCGQELYVSATGKLADTLREAGVPRVNPGR